MNVVGDIRTKQSQGFMIQVIEAKHRNSKCQELGKGRQIEWEMTQDVGTKIFKVHRPRYKNRLDLSFCEDDIERLVCEVQKLVQWWLHRHVGMYNSLYQRNIRPLRDMLYFFLRCFKI